MACIDACHRPEYCDPGDYLQHGDPDGDCTVYYTCLPTRKWEKRTCQAGTQFTLDDCVCIETAISPDCQYRCAPTSPPETGTILSF